MKPIDVSRVKKTKGGHPVRIYATDGGTGCNIHGAVYSTGSGWVPYSWNSNGRLYLVDETHVLNLVEEPETLEVDVWLNVYPDRECVAYSERAKADENAARNRFACIPIKRSVTKSEGLE